MRIVTVRQPWAWAIVHGGKDVENRLRNIAGGYRGPIAIHAGKAFDDAGWDHRALAPILEDALLNDVEIDFVPGAIIGVVDLIDVHDGRDEALHTKDGEVIATRLCSSWAEPDVKHLVLAHPRPLADPIPYLGALGLRHLDDDTTARILAQTGDTA